MAGGTATSVITMVSVLLILIFSALSMSAETKVVSLNHLVQGTGLVSAYFVEQAPLWSVPFMLLAPLRVTVNCSSNTYDVITAASPDQLETEAATKVLWCGWRNIISEPNVCQFQLSTLQDTVFAVKPVQTGLLTIGQPELDCVVTTSAGDLTGDFYWRFAALCLAVLLFRHAATMARSQSFRLTSGGVLGVTGFAVVLMFILFRNVPAKKAIGAGFAISTTSMAALVRWLYGTWAPGLHQVVFSRAAVWYVILTGAGGVALTYWLDDPNNEKINTSIRVGLQGLSLAVVYACIADERVAIAAVLLVAVHRWVLALLRVASSLVLKAVRFVVQSIRAGSPDSFTGAGSGFVQLPEDWEEGSYHSSQDSDYNPSEEEEEELEGGIATDYDSDDALQGGVQEEGLQQQAAAAADGLRWRQAFMWRPGAAAAAAGGVAGGSTAAQGDPDLGSAPSFDRWAQQQNQRAQQRAELAAAQASLAGAAAAGNAGQVRGAGLPSTGGWGPASVAVDRAQQGTSRQQLQPEPEQPAEQRPSSTSPWSEKKVLDITKPKLTSPPSAGAGAAAAAVAGSSHLGSNVVAGNAKVSPLVESGRIHNPETGRSIVLNGPTYNQLVNRGFEPDYVAGTLVLSQKGQPTPPAAAAAHSSRGAPSPASNLRSRKSAGKH